jgi:valyl-tRNA synthetase
MAAELPKVYEPGRFRQQITERWLKNNAFSAVPDGRPRERRYVIMLPLPNVTGALHMGHAMDNVMQDLLIRWHRMMGDNTLWQPGTDHAGIATQAVVEKRLFELEGKSRHDIGREALVARIWAWKDEYQQRIVQQQQQMGCSCDWDRQRFTMDAVCSAAVRESFFRLFADRLIYRGNRLVNWDCQLQTAVSDDEVYHDKVEGYFWYLRYPVIDPRPGEPEYVVVATTRPETMLGDTAVACHPRPAEALEERITEQQQKLADAPARDKKEAEAELQRLRKRKNTHLPELERLVSMAKAGRKVMLPLLDRQMPLILDEWAKPEMGSGCVKITPAHDQNDYEVWQRHADEIDIINILQPDGCLNENAGPYAALDRFDARERVVEDLKARDLIETIENHEVEIGHSDRSKTLIEPYLSKQWFVRMGDVDGGTICGRGTENEFRAAGLAQAAIDAVSESWKTRTGRNLTFHPSRYTNGYVSWLAEKRDWCISRQLWWGHRIPVWTLTCDNLECLRRILEQLPKGTDDAQKGTDDAQKGTDDAQKGTDRAPKGSRDKLRVWVADQEGVQHEPEEALRIAESDRDRSFEIQVCLRNTETDKKYGKRLEELGLEQDPDVLDTWFSSALWPFSTLGWPDPQNAPVDEGQVSLGRADGREDSFSYYYPGSCLVTSRDIITLWVARMVIMGLYIHGEVPFTDSFIHAKILDGKGITMSKSKGNGIDPVDIIERYGADAMRYLICDMETGMQDVRLPVQAICPSCGEVVELTDAKHGQTIFTYLCMSCHAEFDVLGTMPEVASSQVISDRFEVGRNFCNKLWNAARFTLTNLGDLGFQPLARQDIEAEDRWILSRLSRAIREVTAHIAGYRPSAALAAARDFFWGEFCDWYLELVKHRMQDESGAPIARQVLAAILDQILRLLHPFMPFITEQLWGYLNEQASVRGVTEELPSSKLCVLAAWPKPWKRWEDTALEEEFDRLKNVISRLRELRSRYRVSPAKQLPGGVKASGQALASLKRYERLISLMAKLSDLRLGQEIERPKNAATQLVDDVEIFLADVLDPVREKARLEGQRNRIARQLEASRKKLSNKKFISRAPAGIVEAEHKRIMDLESQLALMEKNLRALSE